MPHAGGGPNAFRSVAREIRRKLPVYAICYPGHENRISEPLVDDFSFVAEGIAYCAVFATPFHAPLLQRSMADCHVAMRVALIARGAQAPLLANTAGYALSRCACALTRRLQYG
ncbi:hypothetical protein [Eggerthella sp. 1_3_56FAA]|uniref:hypothetical protein n=1 Tax=Eggerthella sp. 1_3_56FAA TaxID=665943 RepID=UPI00350EB446